MRTMHSLGICCSAQLATFLASYLKIKKVVIEVFDRENSFINIWGNSSTTALWNGVETANEHSIPVSALSNKVHKEVFDLKNSLKTMLNLVHNELNLVESG